MYVYERTCRPSLKSDDSGLSKGHNGMSRTRGRQARGHPHTCAGRPVDGGDLSVTCTVALRVTTRGASFPFGATTRAPGGLPVLGWEEKEARSMICLHTCKLLASAL